MASETPNIGLVKQEGTEYGDYEVTNENLDKIDEEIGKRGKTVNGNGPDASGNYQVNEVNFARQIVTDDAQQMSGEFLFRTTGGDASLTDGPAKLVSIFGRSIHTGIVPESLTMTIDAVPREEGEEEITATIDRDTFVAYVQSSGTITLSYTNAWSANPALYGITVEGDPVSGDQIVVVYVKEDRGLITNSDPSRFVSTGWNLYNHTNGYARVKKYSSQYGFLIGGIYTAIQYSETLTGQKTTITPASGYFTIPDDGYIWVTGGDGTTTYILMTWSDWGEGYEGEWAAYSETEVDLSTIMEDFPYGLMQVEGYADELNFSMGMAISRIERMAYTDANVEIAKASGRPWDADDDYIYIVRASEVTYTFSETGDYTASDHGEEIIEGGTVPVFVQTLYGQNLVDKLRTDVLTISNQTLSAAQKAQVQQNLNVPDKSNLEYFRTSPNGFSKQISGSTAGVNTNGFYWCENTSDTPSLYGYLIVSHHASASYDNYKQIFCTYNTQQVYVRTFINASVVGSGWEELALYGSISELVSKEEVTYGANVGNISGADGVCAYIYKNGMKRVCGAFQVASETLAGQKIFTVPSGYRYDWTKNGQRQAWIRIADGKYALFSYEDITLWSVSLSPGFYVIDYWYC